MPRTIEVSVPPERAEMIVQHVQGMDGVVSLSRQRDVSLDPPGDVVSIQTTNDATRSVIDILRELEAHEAGSIVTSAPRSIISPQHQQPLDQESNETIWDEMAFLLRLDTNLRFNYLALMMLAGATAATGLWSDTLHLVVGSMVIAPAFEPLLRIPFGLITKSADVTKRGLISAVAGYLMLFLGGLIATLILRLLNPGETPDLASNIWVQYWTNITSAGLLASVFASAAGAVVVSGQRSVLTTGVMIALALVPSMSLVGMTVAVGDTILMGQAFIRWIIDVGMVMVLSAVMLGLKQLLMHRSRAFT